MIPEDCKRDVAYFAGLVLVFVALVVLDLMELI